MDSEQLLTCPYNESHQIRRSRFPYHLVKCRKNHPKVANDIRVCPFNARHQIRKAEYKHHLLHCEDGKLAAEGGAQGAESKYSFDSVNFAQQASARETLPSGENWDDGRKDVLR
ncbi:uncharacterized protein [Scyliorhinus torazame]|uniref:uncharacterized protein isoform X2 n=1 Tax=Scyliorhinus torazame TaxID=75743 RepID=UPI003B5A2DE3